MDVSLVIGAIGFSGNRSKLVEDVVSIEFIVNIGLGDIGKSMFRPSGLIHV